MIRFFSLFLREKEKTQVFDKDSRAEAWCESQAEIEKWVWKKQISEQNRDNKCLKQHLFHPIVSERYFGYMSPTTQSTCHIQTKNMYLNTGIFRNESFLRKFGSRSSLTRTNHWPRGQKTRARPNTIYPRSTQHYRVAPFHFSTFTQ
jgi:hypothetical protein